MASSPYRAWAGDSCSKPGDPSAGALVTAQLETGETLKVTYRGCDQESLLLEHPLLGLLTVARSAVLSLSLPPSPPAAAPAVSTPPASIDQSDWLLGVELGLNGALGNSQRYNLRLAASAERSSPKAELLAEIRYVRAEAATENDGDDDGDGVVDDASLELTDSKVLASLRNDWILTQSRWRYFLLATTDVDQFKDYDLRWSLASGPGYTFLKTTGTTLIGRVGVGLSQELGGEDQAIVPELLLGGDWKQRLGRRQQLSATLTVYPDLSEFGELRSVAKGSWDIDLDPERNLKLRLGIEDRYDSKPADATVKVGGVDRTKRTIHNDLDYYATLLFEF